MNAEIVSDRETAGVRVKVVHEGETVDAEELSFKLILQSKGTYETSDGVTITLSHEAKAIYKLCDKHKADGSPIYLVTGAVEMATTKTKDSTEKT
jgi:hypothetical protein